MAEPTTATRAPADCSKHVFSPLASWRPENGVAHNVTLSAHRHQTCLGRAGLASESPEAGDDPINASDPTGLCSRLRNGTFTDANNGPDFLVTGPCPRTPSRALAAESQIQARYAGGGFSWTNGLKAVADYGAGIAHTFAAVSCTSSTFCAAVDSSGYEVSWSQASSTTSTVQLLWDNLDALGPVETQASDALPSVLSDGSNYYVYGANGSPVEQIALSSSTPTYMDYDPVGHTWTTINASGAPQNFWAYDAFGNAQSGTPSMPFGDDAQFIDPASRLVNDRARFYEPTTGTFTTRDPAFANTDTAYTYAGGDPVNGMDPTGLWGWDPISDATQAWNDTGGKAVHGVKVAAVDTGHFLSDPSRWRAEADYAAAVGNAIVSTVTFGQLHISTPYCDVPGWVSDLGNGVGFALTAVAGGEAIDALGGLLSGAEITGEAAEGSGGSFVHIDVGGEGAYNSINLNPSEVGSLGKIPNLVKGLGQQMPFGTSTADLVTAENIPLHQGGIVDEIARVVQPGGSVWLVNPADYEPAVAAHSQLIDLLGGNVSQVLGPDGLLRTWLQNVGPYTP